MDKVTDLSSAVSTIEAGCHLALTGFAITRNAIAATEALIKQGARNLTLSQVVGGMETDLLVGSGCVDHLNYSGGSLDRFGPLHSVNRAISDGSISATEYSSLTLTLRLQAGALGLPFVAALPMLGSELLTKFHDSDGVMRGVDPFTGKPVVLLAPLQPDVAIVHADAADNHGNAVVYGPRWSLRETALAAESVIVTCERLAEPGSLCPNSITIPGEIVTAVVVAPGGARPTAVFESYDYDRTQLELFANASRLGKSEFKAYVRSCVFNRPDPGSPGDLPGQAA
jgi:glutaconate CoA-transferase subunit A